MNDPQAIGTAYDGSTAAFRALEAFGWGELVNLGYYPMGALPATMFGLAPFQRGLVKRSLGLLAPAPGERVLDAACGRGGTTARIAACGAEVLGLDLLPENVAEAEARFGSLPGVRFDVADVTRLPARAAGIEIAPASFDAVLCLEAGFHFGAKGRRAFLEESWRVLRPGGRLVLVDFGWRDAQPEAIGRLDAERAVRGTWRFDEFEPLARYRELAVRQGFAVERFCDWTRPVIDRFQFIATALARIGNLRAGRALLCALRPGLASLSPEDWRGLVALMRAHDRVRRASRYVAFRLAKPR